MQRLAFLFLLFLPTIVVNASRVFTIKNECPAIIKVFLKGGNQIAKLPAYGGTFISPPFSDDFQGLIYTDANGATPGTPGTMVGIVGTKNYYYIVKDANLFNIGVSVRPTDRSPNDGFCLKVTCADFLCPSFPSPPPPPKSFPSPGPVAQAAPLFECKEPNTGFTVTFCPGGTFPLPPPRSFRPNPTATKCLTVQTNAGVVSDGSPVHLADCDSASTVQKWIFWKGYTKFYLAGTEFCLDAGSSPGNGVEMKVQKCLDGLAIQEWLFNDDNQVILAGKGQCLELENGVSTDPNKVQTWQCEDGKTSQLWYAV